MIDIYTGTPGSGKSLHVADRIKVWVEVYKRPVICNFTVNLQYCKAKGDGTVYTVPNSRLNEENLINFSKSYFQKRNERIKEDTILLVIDEAQLIFNARSWNDKERKNWISFFTQHRKLGYRIILVSQWIEMLDKQIRPLIEYEVIHRKVKNISKGAALISIFAGGNLHIWIKVYNGLGQKTDSGFFRGNKILWSMYDTYTIFGE